MTNTMYTLGPWAIGKPHAVSIGGYDSPISCISVERPNFVAGGGVALVRIRNPEEATATANLIAAAPELLNALIMLVGWKAAGAPASDLVFAQARAAIIKATASGNTDEIKSTFESEQCPICGDCHDANSVPFTCQTGDGA